MNLHDEFIEAARKLAEGEAKTCYFLLSSKVGAFKCEILNEKFEELFEVQNFGDFSNESQSGRILACLFAALYYKDENVY